MPENSRLHLAVALADAGWHPAAWRDSDAGGGDLLTADYWGEQIVEAERGLLDFVTMEDSPALQSARPGTPDDRADQVSGRLDTLLVAAYTARLTTRIGLVPAATIHSDPFRLATTVATLDHLTGGRVGWRPLSAAHGVSMPGPRRTPPRFTSPRDPGVAEYLTGAVARRALAPVRRGQRRRRLPHPAGDRRGDRDRGLGPQARGGGGPQVTPARLRRPRRLPGPDRAGGADPPATAGRAGGRGDHLGRTDLHRNPGGPRRPARRLARPRGRGVPAPPRRLAPRPAGHHPRRRPGPAGARAVPRWLRGHDPAGTAGPAPPGRRRGHPLTGRHDRNTDPGRRAVLAGGTGRELNHTKAGF
ncbi:hypothetical protein FRACA_240004 [Frankia canadensis]|uniref:Luciferase-like domain-containing protein n=1 Tax=Frankia canadensis TaxID=1836972 RepID=A0A2I2KRP5_9ACTN|nr:hypothetical protein FRACA_240004 [Frankia canadensis]SOU55620.1 hypothetical protein FRACA_240004 [Frankia canadensis]